MKLSWIGFVALLPSTCAGQVTSPHPICFAFNDTSPAITASVYGGCPSFSSSNQLWVHFTAPTTAAVDVIEVNAASNVFICPIVWGFVLYQTPALGVQPSGSGIAVFNGDFLGLVPAWVSLSAATPTTLVAGATYAISVYVGPAFPQTCSCPLPCLNFSFDPSGGTQLPYHVMGTGCQASFPTSGTVGLMIRFRGLACGPGPLASVGPIGVSCGQGAGGPGSALTSSTPPVLGSAWTLSVSGPAGGIAYLFWSGGISPGGSPIATGSSCLHYLDSASLAMLAAVGAEPLATSTIPQSSQASWSFGLTPDPFYAGFVLGAQAVIVSPTGAIPLGGGLFGQATNALKVTLGY